MEQDNNDTPLAVRAGFARLGLHRAEPPPRLGDLSALLAEIDGLRTSLQADLSMVAAALDADAVPVAQELIDEDLLAVAGFEDRALGHLQVMKGAEASQHSAKEAGPVAPPLPTLAQVRARRRRRAMSAPLLVAAAALLGFAAGAVPERMTEPPPASIVASTSVAAEASYELSRLVLEGAPSDELRQAAEVLHDGVVEMIATSEGNPATAAEAMMLLQYSNEVLVLAGDQGSLQGVLAQGRELTEHLRGSLSPAAPGVVPVLTGRPPALAPQPLRRVESAPTPTSSDGPGPTRIRVPDPDQPAVTSLVPRSVGPVVPVPEDDGGILWGHEPLSE